MKVKNVLKGLKQQYNLEEINIIATSKVLYSGSLDGFAYPEIDMIPFKKQVENLEVINRMMFNGRKAFIFVPDIDTYYPAVNYTV